VLKMGYLICDKCGGSYELEESESPEDVGKCDCGGNLKYVEKLESGILNSSFSKKKDVIINWKLIAIAIIAYFILWSFISFILSINISVSVTYLPMITISIFVSCMLGILIGIYLGFSVNLNPKNGLFNGLIAGFILGIISVIFNIGAYVFFGEATIPELFIVIIILDTLLFGIGGSIGGLWRNHKKINAN
jgi:hypothetical protein